ncbi:hypothetical protein DFH07DRAFT_956661 [Mycena maculata]|uniref:Uncharacterized protein n=1 Tax=Mycena maculata TaxID=230809 RepID=A0AAD7JDS5_9AGAR|nr:hypothetical protein DFH07DRAFT_956661 [Mycena maculata]
MSSESQSRTDVILAMQGNYMQDILAYVCEIDPARTRNLGDAPLPEGPLGNAEFNTVRDGEWERYDYPYRVRSVWWLKEAIGLQDMKHRFGMKRSIIFLVSRQRTTVPESADLIPPAERLLVRAYVQHALDCIYSQKPT